MTDRELLEAAARAAGILTKWEPTHEALWIEPGQGLVIDIWNPLADDGQTLRLAAKLGMEILPQEPLGVLCVIRRVSHARAKEPYGEDRNAATRRAIVRAAAAMAG
jgi:hypothetical protein